MRIEWDDTALKDLVRSHEMAAALEGPGRAVEAEAKRLAPVRTGRLRDAITTREGADSEGPYLDVVSPVLDEQGNPRGLYDEVGTKDTPPHPYLRPAVDILR